jgi:cellulose synthase/poly-beta-1,6-N-acetylglucosamine synthase-like glycosyltransferase
MSYSDILTVCAAAGASLYAAVAIYLIRGLRKLAPRRTDQPSVTIVVPVRNEETHLAELLESISALDYPRERAEIIVVNDQSTDRTREIAESFRDKLPFALRVVDVNPAGETLVAKTRPLAQGIEQAHNEFILMTDADCVVPAGWANGMVSHFSEGVGMVCGMTLPASTNGHAPAFHKFERCDWYFLLGVTAGFSGRGNAQALIGNNYAVRRATYERLGGFRQMPFNKIDDISLMSAIRNEGREQIVMPAEENVLINTQPVKSFSDLVRQRQRWLKAWPFAALETKAALLIGFLAHATIPLWPWLFGWVALPLLAVLVLSDVAVVFAMRTRFRDHAGTGAVWLYPFFTCAYGIALFLNLLTGRKTPWKGRDF